VTPLSVKNSRLAYIQKASASATKLNSLNSIRAEFYGRRPGSTSQKIVRFLIGNPLIMKDNWTAGAGIQSGVLFRSINKARQRVGNGFTPFAEHVRAYVIRPTAN